MRTIAILPMKGFDVAKQRLAPTIRLGHRRALIEAMFADTLVALRRTSGIDRIFVITPDGKAGVIAAGDNVTVIEDTGSSHSEAAMLGISRAIEIGATRALLVPGDCPLIDPLELDQLLARALPPPSVIIIPDRHGEGTNALLLTPPGAMAPAFGDGSCRRHSELAAAQGVAAEVVALESMALDIDTPEDLDELLRAFETTRGRAAHTRGMLTQMTRSRLA